MFVPFVFILEPGSDYDHIAPFYKYLDMSRSFDWPVIAHERYFNRLDEMAKLGIDDSWFSAVGNQWKFSAPTQEDLDRIHQYQIPQEFEDEVTSRFPSETDAWVYLLTHNDPQFEEMILGFFDDIEEKLQEPIEGILCFCVPASLRAAADRKGITIFSQEGCAFRPPFYKNLMFYNDRRNSYGQGELRERYYRFKSENSNVPMLSRKGIIRLFANEKFLKDLYLMDCEPAYQLGIAVLPVLYGLHYQYSRISSGEIAKRARRKWSSNDILIRDRPGFPSQMGTDRSPSSFHFICKCAGIAAIQSNMLFEAMLYGRKAYGYGSHPFSFMESKGIEDEVTEIAPLDFLNFVVFAYFVPAEWMTDVEHLRFLLSEPNETEIYLKSFHHHTKHLSAEELQCLDTDEADPPPIDEPPPVEELTEASGPVPQGAELEAMPMNFEDLRSLFESRATLLEKKIDAQEEGTHTLLTWMNHMKYSLPYRVVRKSKKWARKIFRG